MNGFIKLAGILLITVFILGCFTAGFYTYVVMPKNLLAELNVSETEGLALVRDSVSPILLTVVAELVLGILAVGYYFYDKQNNRSAHIVYIEKKSEVEADTEEETLADREARYLRDKEMILSSANRDEPLEVQGEKLFNGLCKVLEAAVGAFYIREDRDDSRRVKIYATYAFSVADSDDTGYEFGEGPVGQAAKEGKVIHIQSVPEGYIQAGSGLGQSSPDSLLVIPCGPEKENTRFVAEIARFGKFDAEQIRLAEEVLRGFCSETVSG